MAGADLVDNTKYSLLIDADGDFSNASVTTGGTFNGNKIEFSGVNLSNGQYFSLAYENTSPIAGFGTALTFDGTDDYIDVPSGINIANSSFTYEAWAKRNGTGTADAIIGIGTSTTNAGIYFGFSPGNNFGLNFYNNNFIASSPVIDNNWHHWASVFEQGVGKKIYQNGVLVGQSANTDNYTGSDNFRIGNAPWDSLHEFSGQIDEVRVWDDARTQAEIQANMDNTLAGTESNLVGYWKFEDNTGTTAADSSPNTNDGTLNGDITWPFSTKQNTPLSDTLANFVNSDPDGDAFTYIIVDDDSGAAVIDDANTGTFTYTPNTFGTRTFTYKVNDGLADSNVATVTVEVLPNNAPIVGFGTALTFDGTDDGIDLPETSSLNFLATDNITLEAYFKTTSTNLQIIFSQQKCFTNGVIQLFLDSNGNPVFRLRGTSSTEITVTLNIVVNDGNWHHLAAVRNVTSDTVIVYLDGIEQANVMDNTTGNITDSSGTNWIGRRDNCGGTDEFNGQIDEVRLWKAARTQAEIQANMNNTLTGTEPNLVGYWKFEDNTGTIATDSSPNGNNGTLNGGITWPPLFSTKQNTPLSDTLANFVNSDPDGDAFTYIIVDDDGGAAVIDDANTGAFTYTPNTFGTRTFTYKVNDGLADSNVATVTVEVLPNNAPIVGFGTALTFDGVDDYINASPTFSSSPSTLTLEAWVRQNTVTNQDIIDYGDTGNSKNIIQLRINLSKFDIAYGAPSSVTNLLAAADSLTANMWTHLAMVKNGTNVSLYVNGTLSASSASFTNTPIINQLYFGSMRYMGTNGLFFDGQIDEVRVWDDVRTEAEIQANMNNIW
ncbi:LamG domain-containing protein [Candidatus Halobeggiatoa sp. HSG11]|nr:LamG domain-containing protein [Candidatus Halobeggiatoa sp. HSG11]